MGVVAVVYNSTAFSISTVLAYITVSRRSIVTMARSRVVSEIFNVEKYRDLEIGVRGHSRSSKVLSFDRPCMVSY